MFPNENTPSMIFNGVPFSHIPVCNVKVTKNNTIIYLGDHESKSVLLFFILFQYVLRKILFCFSF